MYYYTYLGQEANKLCIDLIKNIDTKNIKNYKSEIDNPIIISEDQRKSMRNLKRKSMKSIKRESLIDE